MSMTKEEAAVARAKVGQKDGVVGLDLVGKQIRGTFEYFGVENEYKCITDATPVEFLQPGFLDPVVKENKSYLGAFVRVVAKSESKDPSDWSFGTVVICAVKGCPLLDRDGDRVKNDAGSLMFHSETLVGLVGKFSRPKIVDDRLHEEPKTNGRKKFK